MSKLSAFLHPKPVPDKELILSGRFVDEKGQPIPVKIRGIMQADQEQLAAASTHPVTLNGQEVEKLDMHEYNTRLVLKAMVDPCLTSAEACQEYGVADPMQIPGRLFTSGEFTKLTNEIAKLSGFGKDKEEAKN